MCGGGVCIYFYGKHRELLSSTDQPILHEILIKIEGNHNLFNIEICIGHILCSIALVGNTKNKSIF